jgi:hypothetical protein
VRKCSSEGRASMTMDLFSLHEGLNGIHVCRPPRGKHHIDNYLRTAYLNEEDLMNWVKENYQSYAYRHIHGLLTQMLASVMNNKKLKEATAVLDVLYGFEGGGSNSNSNITSKFEGGTSKLGTLFANSKARGEDATNKFSNLLSNSFRRQDRTAASGST